MKRLLRIIAAVLLLGSVAFWVATGARRDFSQTQREIKTVDPVTGLDIIQWQKDFVPGIDFLAGTVFVTALLAGVSFLFGRKQTKA